MNPGLDTVKALFRAGQHALALSQCEALVRERPQDTEAKRLCATMHGMVDNFGRSLELLRELQRAGVDDADLLFNIGMCERGLQDHGAALQTFRAYTEKFPGQIDGWAARAECAEALGQLEEAAEAYKAALKFAPADDNLLKKATSCLLQLDRASEGIALCREALKADPGNVTARLGAEWLLAQVVPLWHVPMVNEAERNDVYFDALKAVVKPGQRVFEIGTGSGLVAMMAAKLGADVVTCEAVGLVAETAARIVADNNLQDRVRVLAKPSYAVQVPADLPQKADVLVHEIFSSELLGEHVLAALEDAKLRLLKPGGEILPGVGSIMVALVGGDALGRELHVGEVHGFDLRAFNAINPKKRPIHREDLPRELMGDAVEAFRFDFKSRTSFPPERKRLQLTATRAGRCWGVIQWIRFEFAPGIAFENHPARARPVANWQHTVYRFDEPLELREGQVVAIDASHDRSRPWFERAV
ncbi:tetratricopeptide repeat protein [Ramlibacter albus]|uniref:Tetratricopeptide repeat protein n=1 Tax=Ramlibacter albus TaxID=2079448 RepID=A0A923S338_9BURK|nr:tetratricopeptide repeat protein [Ramlibacter albus]MBC5766040.1 tetratricopeptide repeat protein [Ramlibacter albus]